MYKNSTNIADIEVALTAVESVGPREKELGYEVIVR